MYLVVLIAIRAMGKAELSKMDPFQMVILFMMAELASIPIDTPDSSLIYGIGAIFTLLLLQVIISVVCLKSEKMRFLFSGRPSILINNGKLDKEELTNQRINLDDLNEHLRLKNMPSLADVDFAILEANGDLSVIPKPDKRPVTPADLSMQKSKETVPVVIISDGCLYMKNLDYVGFTEKRLKKELAKVGLNDYKEVFLCLCDENKNFHIYENSSKHLSGDKNEKVKSEVPHL